MAQDVPLETEALLKVTCYSEGACRYSEWPAALVVDESAEPQQASPKTPANAGRNNGDYPAGIRWIVRVKLGLCVVYALLILMAGLALALKLPVTVPAGQLMGLMLGLGAFGVFEGLEAYGLKRRQAWGSYLTVGRTLVMLPYSLYLMVSESDPIKELALLALNAVIVLYLVRDLPRLKRN